MVAYNTRDALDALTQHPEIGLLFTDLIMPGGINGVMLAQEARRRRPRLRILLTTGYADASIARSDLDATESLC
ncbi:response regulator [Caballeronia sp. NK8]|uniref:response regulator n=1 Tax=Caballeronia sp. NK8 TaxID=140098 RepID=UPI001BD13A6F